MCVIYVVLCQFSCFVCIITYLYKLTAINYLYLYFVLTTADRQVLYRKGTFLESGCTKFHQTLGKRVTRRYAHRIA